MALPFTPAAFAATYNVTDTTTLTQAVSDANTDGDSTTDLQLGAGITITTPAGTVFNVATNPSLLNIVTTGAGSTLNLNGAGTVWDSGSYSTVGVYGGVAGSDALSVTNGAAFRVRGFLSFTAGDLRVTGAGSTLTSDGDFVAGRSGDVNIFLLNGGQISTGSGSTGLGEGVGNTAASNITALVDGVGTAWHTNFFYIGGASNRVDVTLSGGATFTADGGGAVGSNGVGTLLVTGPGSTFSTGDGYTYFIGQYRFGTLVPSQGTLTISNSGRASISRLVMASGDASASGTLVVNTGGVLETAALVHDIGSANVTFDNGTLRALADSSSGSPLIDGFAGTDFTIGAGGMFLDSNGFNVTSSSVMSGVGGLTKQGDGIFTLTASNTYGGATLISRGTLQAGIANAFSAASAHTVAAGATLDTGGFNQVVASLDNSGIVTLVGSAPGSTLRVTGNYVGHNGLLKLGTVLGDSNSASDRLVIDGAGASASGTTTVQITNFGGLGAQTTGNGIEVISAINGATTTAQTTKDAFSLANGHVDAGAYEYRLYAADASGNGESWYLRSSLATSPEASPTLTYRTEVPLFAALPEQLRQSGMAMLGNLHQRMGDNEIGGGDSSADAGNQRQAWGRAISVDRGIAQGGTVSPRSKGRLAGFQSGTDLWAGGRWRSGVYVGQLDGDMNVNGFASGIVDRAVGSSSLRGQYFGVYATYRDDGGWYADTVLQTGRLRYNINPSGGTTVSGKSRSLLVSIEAGKSFPLFARWRVEPQLQLMRQRMDLDDPAISNAQVQQSADDTWTARAGVRIKGEISVGAGSLQPYGRFNVYRSSGGTDTTRFVGSADTTDIVTRTGGVSSELVAGATLQLNGKVSLYGEFGKLWANSDAVRTNSGINGSLGLKVFW